MIIVLEFRVSKDQPIAVDNIVTICDRADAWKVFQVDDHGDFVCVKAREWSIEPVMLNLLDKDLVRVEGLPVFSMYGMNIQ